MQNHYFAKTVQGIISLSIAQLSLLDFPLETLKSTTEYYTETNQRIWYSCNVKRLVHPLKLSFLQEPGILQMVLSSVLALKRS